MYLIKSESFLALLDSNVTEMFPGPESKFISKTVHVTSVEPTEILQSYENTFCA